MRPRTSSFNAVLTSWSKCKSLESADRAADLLAFMERLAEAGDSAVAPDVTSYHIVVGALSRMGNEQSSLKAGAFLNHVEKACLSGNQNIVPDTLMYNSVMGCWSKTNISGSFIKARDVLDRQIALYENGYDSCRPDVYGFTSVIGSCAVEMGDENLKVEAFQIALETFEQLSEYDNPNHVTYGTMLKACALLLHKNERDLRRKYIKEIFKSCVRDGCVGDMVVSRLREACSPFMYRRLMQGHSKRTLPKEWTRNVNEKREQRRKNIPRKRRGEV